MTPPLPSFVVYPQSFHMQHFLKIHEARDKTSHRNLYEIATITLKWWLRNINAAHEHYTQSVFCFINFPMKVSAIFVPRGDSVAIVLFNWNCTLVTYFLYTFWTFFPTLWPVLLIWSQIDDFYEWRTCETCKCILGEQCFWNAFFSNVWANAIPEAVVNCFKPFWESLSYLRWVTSVILKVVTCMNLFCGVVTLRYARAN